MTDFLTSLAARSFATETRIRPRLASVFEPDSGLTSANSRPLASHTEGLEQTSEFEGSPKSVGKNVKTPDPRHAAKVRHAEVNGAPQLSSESSDGPLSRVEIQARAREDGAVTTLISRDPVLNEEPKLSDPFNLCNVQPILPSRLATHRNEEPNDLEAVRRPSQGQSSPDRESTSGHLSPLMPHRVVEERTLLTHSSKESTELAAQMRDAAAAMGAIHGAPRKENTSRTAQASMAESDSGVHVTIGRVEVRAVTESNRVSRRPAASPVMGLDEYLQVCAQRGAK